MNRQLIIRDDKIFLSHPMEPKELDSKVKQVLEDDSVLVPKPELWPYDLVDEVYVSHNENVFAKGLLETSLKTIRVEYDNCDDEDYLYKIVRMTAWAAGLAYDNYIKHVIGSSERDIDSDETDDFTHEQLEGKLHFLKEHRVRMVKKFVGFMYQLLMHDYYEMTA